jgi:hypothetical protein
LLGFAVIVLYDPVFYAWPLPFNPLCMLSYIDGLIECFGSPSSTLSLILYVWFMAVSDYHTVWSFKIGPLEIIPYLTFYCDLLQSWIISSSAFNVCFLHSAELMAILIWSSSPGCGAKINCSVVGMSWRLSNWKYIGSFFIMRIEFFNVYNHDVRGGTLTYRFWFNSLPIHSGLRINSIAKWHCSIFVSGLWPSLSIKSSHWGFV